MSKDLDAYKSSRENILQSFLQCFYVDHFGRLDIAWDRYVPFGTLYTQLTSVPVGVNERVQFKLDEVRVFMLFACICGQINNGLRSTVTEKGSLVISEILLGKPDIVPSMIKEQYSYFKTTNIVNEHYLHECFRAYDVSAIRQFCDGMFPSRMEELTYINNIVTNLIMKVGILSFD